jgi:hypothetical protein
VISAARDSFGFAKIRGRAPCHDKRSGQPSGLLAPIIDPRFLAASAFEQADSLATEWVHHPMNQARLRMAMRASVIVSDFFV